MDFFINIWWSGLDFYLPWFILKSPEMGQYCNSLRKMCIRITEKLIRTGLSWSLVQAPAWSRANFKVCGGCSGPCVVEFWKSPKVEIEHPFQVPLPISCGAQGRIFSYIQLEFPFCSLGVLSLILSLCSPEKSLALSTLPTFSIVQTTVSIIRQIFLRLCACLFSSPSASLVVYSASDWQHNLVFRLPQAATYLGSFKARSCFYLVLFKRVLWKLPEQKMKLGVASREVPVLNSCLPNINVSYYHA